MSYNKVASASGKSWDNEGSSSKLDDNDDQFLITDEIDDDDEQGFVQVGHQPVSSDLPPPPTPPLRQQQQPPPSYSLDASFSTTTGQLIEQRRFMGGDTLDEPITATLMRDVRSIGYRLRQVVWHAPASSLNNRNQQQQYNVAAAEWDLWGPLVFSLLISFCLSMLVPPTHDQSSIVFSGVFALIWLGQAVVTVNIKLLGASRFSPSATLSHSISFFQAMSVTGYCLFPLVPAVLLSSFVSLLLVRAIVDLVLVAWAIYAATKGLQDSGVQPSQVFLAMFPVGLFYTGIGWLCVIS